MTARAFPVFYGGDYADNTLSATNKQVEIVAVLPAATPGGEDEISVGLKLASNRPTAPQPIPYKL